MTKRDDDSSGAGAPAIAPVQAASAAWRVGEVRHGGRYQLVEHDGRKGYVCEVQAPFHSSGAIDEELREERCRLIAAAPDLLASALIDHACHHIGYTEKAVVWLAERGIYRDPSMPMVDWQKAARAAAIKRATES